MESVFGLRKRVRSYPGKESCLCDVRNIETWANIEVQEEVRVELWCEGLATI